MKTTALSDRRAAWHSFETAPPSDRRAASAVLSFCHPPCLPAVLPESPHPPCLPAALPESPHPPHLPAVFPESPHPPHFPAVLPESRLSFPRRPRLFPSKKDLILRFVVVYYVGRGALAQLGARHNGIVEVTGSNPVCSRSRKSFKIKGFRRFYVIAESCLLIKKDRVFTLCSL